MLLLPHTETDPYFNLAAEEFLLREKEEDVCMLWRNNRTIVLGKHQNAMAEINTEFVRRSGIQVVRRLSGGGTVYHDLGNINFTFIRNTPENERINVDFKVFTTPVVQALAGLGVVAEHSGRNDLLVHGMKISGNAEHVFQQKKRTLHHGTLLFSSRLGDLSDALKVNPLRFEDKAVRSVRSRVTNIREHLKEDMDAEEFYKYLVTFMSGHFKHARIYEFTSGEREEIKKLAATKYKTWEWNFGYSPRYRFRKLTQTASGDLCIELSAEKGVINEIRFDYAGAGKELLNRLAEMMHGCRHDPDDLDACIKNAGLSEPLPGITREELVSALI